MSERSEYNDGEFCWVDLMTTDAEGAAKFYGELLGADSEAAPGNPEDSGGYSFFVKDGKQIAGFMPAMQEGAPPAWTSYIKVSSADDTAGKVKEAGGTVVVEPLDIPNGTGRMAAFQDPTGAFFGVFEPKDFQGAQLVNEIGTWTWSNLLTRDVDAAEKFYGDVFGWRKEHNDEAPDFVSMWQVEGQQWPEGLGGLMEMGSEMPVDAPPYWQVYFCVADLDAAIEQTKSAGGQLIFGPQPIPVGKVAVLFDPQGANFSLIEPDYPEPR